MVKYLVIIEGINHDCESFGLRLLSQGHFRYLPHYNCVKVSADGKVVYCS